MLYLSSDDELQYAISKCLHNSGFRVAIAFGTAIRSENSLTQIQHLLEGRNDCHIWNSRNGFEIQFENGSYLFSITALNNAYGRRSHLLIVDKTIDCQIVNEVLKPYEIIYSDDYKTKFEQYLYDHVVILKEPMFKKKGFYNIDTIENNNTDYPEVSEIEFLKLI